MNETVLVAEDERALRTLLRNNLSFAGYRVLEAADGEDAVRRIVAERPDAVVLDVGLPGRDGLSVLRELRGRGLGTPVLLLTARAEESDRIAGLDQGADDYVVKPFSIGELLARIRALLRRTVRAATTPVQRFGDLEIDLDGLWVRRGRRQESLAYFEAEILRVLLRRIGDAVSRRTLLDEVWGREAHPTTRAVDNHILALRRRIEVDPAEPRHILTIHRVGYRFVP